MKSRFRGIISNHSRSNSDRENVLFSNQEQFVFSQAQAQRSQRTSDHKKLYTDPNKTNSYKAHPTTLRNALMSCISLITSCTESISSTG